MLAKSIEVLVADGSGRGTYLPIAPAGLKMPVENQSITVANRRFYCVDPRDGAAVFEFAKPRKSGLVQASDDRQTICVGSLAVDPQAEPLLERIECDLRIDDDYIAHATLRSLGREETVKVEFHELEFGLALPSSSGVSKGPGPQKNEGNATNKRTSMPPRHRSASNSNITLRSNLAPKDDDWRVRLRDWEIVPGDLVEKWRAPFRGPRFDQMTSMQLAERNYYLPCSRCGRTLYSIRMEGPNEVCRQYRCSEVRS